MTTPLNDPLRNATLTNEDAAAINPSTSRRSCRLLYDPAILPDDDGKMVRAVLGADIVRGAEHRAFGTGHKCRGFLRLGGVSVLFHAPINFRTASLSCVEEMARGFAGSPRLSQTIHRVASGR